jgi:hypothetical protein
MARCVICIRTGAWPPRLHDVQETETMLMNEQEDLRRLEEEARLQENGHV